MLTDSRKMVNYAKILTGVFGAVFLPYSYGFAVFRQSGEEYFEASLCNAVTAAMMLITIAILFFGYLTKGTDKKTKWKLLPFSFAVYGALSLVFSVLYNMLEVALTAVRIEQSVTVSFVTMLIPTALTAVLGFTVLPRYVQAYADLFIARQHWIFPAYCGLRHNWWFWLVASLVSAMLTGLNNVAFSLLSTALASSVNSAVMAVVKLALYFLLFHIAFHAIDSKTRRLFYTCIFGAFGYGAPLASLASVFSSAGLKYTDRLLDNLMEFRVNPEDLWLLLLFFSVALAVLVLDIVGYWGMYKSLSAWEEVN